MKQLIELYEMAHCPNCGEDLDKKQEQQPRGNRVSSGHPDDRTHTRRRPPTPGFNKLGSGAREAAQSRASAFPSNEEEEHGGLDNYDLAIDMINQAVEQHNLRDEFEKIADVDSLVDHLKATRHDFTNEVEQNIRDIIADEMGHGEQEQQDNSWQDAEEEKQKYYDEEEEFRGGGKYKRGHQGPEFRGGGKHRKGSNYFSSKENTKFTGALKKAARMIVPKSEEEEERKDTQSILDDNEKRRQARKYAIHGPSRRRARHSLRNRRQQTASHSPFTVGFEQEEEKDDWNEEVRKFRQRRKTYEPKYARRSSPRSRRRNTSDSGVFNVRFESFKQFNEMYRDSQHGLTIDLSGPEGNAFAVLGVAKNLAKQLDKDWKQIQDDMTHSDYDHLLDVFEREFGSVVSLLNRPGEDMARIKNQGQSDIREPGGDGNSIAAPHDSRRARGGSHA